MKNEFNLRSANPLEMLGALLLAGPAVLLTAQQYGWTGLVIAGTFLGASHYFDWVNKVVSKAANKDPVLAEEFPNVDTADEIRLQRACDELSSSYGIDRIPTTMIKPSKLAAFCLPKNVYVTSEMVGTLSDKELRFVVAHELDHIRSKDHKINAAHYTAVSMNRLAFLASSVDLLFLNHALNINQYPRLSMVFFAYLGINISLALAKAAASRTIEYRADTNAATVTKEPEIGIRALRATMKIITDSVELPKNKGFISSLFMSHPHVQYRLRNLRKMGHKRIIRTNPVAVPLV